MNEELFEPIVVPIFGKRCSFVFEEDPDDVDVRAALQCLLDPANDALLVGERHVRRYCEDVLAWFPKSFPKFEPPMKLEDVVDIWSHVEFGDEIIVTRRARGDLEDGIYFSLECSCDWEPEHGLQLVVRDGRTLSKVGPYDGALTNVDAYGDPGLAGVVYRPIGD